MTPDISIVVPMFNERDCLEAMADDITAAFSDIPHEMIFVDDGGRDGSRAALIALKSRHPTLRVLGHPRRLGQSRAIRTGVLAARAPVVVMLDGDCQYDPADAVGLARRLSEGPSPIAMVAGERVARHDKASRRLASRLANAVTRWVLNSPARDSGCGLKVFHRDAFMRLPYFDHMHRYLPVLMRREGFAVAFEPITHRPRPSGVSKYTNLGRLWVSIPDLLGVFWLTLRMRQPDAGEEF
jgi:glycosyltransferase involved in cell wall biosynthesis